MLFTNSQTWSQEKSKVLNDNIPEEEINRIFSLAKSKYSLLNDWKQRTNTAPIERSAAHVLFGWPMRCNGEYDGIPNYYMIQNYVDNDPTSGIIDFSCGNRTYDDHRGTDINIWPFWWNMMSKDYVQVVAAAPGIVIDVFDGNNNDDNCFCGSNNNGIVILHADSSTSIYYHIQFQSAKVAENDLVTEGQPIALVGSSGCSSNPHLHFEARTKDNVVIDPWVGSNPSTDCNPTTSDSWWKSQKPLWEPQINRIMTHAAQPELTGFNNNLEFCSYGESVRAKNNFVPGEPVVVGIAVHDYLDNSSLFYTVDFPNSTVISGIHTNSAGFNLPRWYVTFSFLLPTNAPAGTYTVSATYQGKTYYHYFSVSCFDTYNLTTTLSGARGFIASGSIQSTSVITSGSDVRLQAGGSIVFSPGFTATAGSVLKARIKDCNFTE
jgi:murein DD-endopeptidase MepM/ murein hydrolase activator NlpD